MVNLLLSCRGVGTWQQSLLQAPLLFLANCRSSWPALATAISTCHAATARMSTSNLHLLTASDPSSLPTQSRGFWPQEDGMLSWWYVDDVCEAAYHCYTTTGNHTGNIYWFTQSQHLKRKSIFVLQSLRQTPGVGRSGRNTLLKDYQTPI